MSDTKPKKTSYKVVLLGDTESEKTKLLSKFTGLSASENESVGASFITYKMTIDGHTIKLELWDSAGQERFTSMNAMYIRGADVIIICFDSSSLVSKASKIKSLYEAIRLTPSPSCEVFFAATKVHETAKISIKQALDKLSNEMSIESSRFFCINTESGEGIDELKTFMGRTLISKFPEEFPITASPSTISPASKWKPWNIFNRNTKSKTKQTEEPSSALSTTTTNPQNPIVTQTEEDENFLPVEYLIAKATSPLFESKFSTQFLLTFHLHTTPIKLLQLLEQRYYEKSVDGAPIPGRLRVFSFMKNWIEKLWNVSTPQELVQSMDNFLQKASSEPAFGSMAAHLRRKIEEKTSGLEHNFHPTFEKPPPVPLVPISFVSGTHPEVSVNTINLKEIARQLTLIESEMFRNIKLWEFHDINALLKKDISKVPNIHAFQQHFHRVCKWISDSILSKPSDKEKTKTLELCLDLAEECNQLQNFNAVNEILTGCDFVSFNWQGISSKHKAKFEELLSLTKRENIMRKKLHSLTPPCVPILEMFISALNLIEENPTMKGNLINWGKCKLKAEVIIEIQLHQTTIYNFQTVPWIHDFFVSKPSQSETKENTENFSEEQSKQPQKSECTSATNLQAVQITPSISLKLTKESNVEEVCKWLNSIGFSELEPIFKSNKISGLALFELTDSHLKDLGIKALGDRLTLMATIKKVQESTSSTSTSIPSSVVPQVNNSAMENLKKSKFGSQTNESVRYKGALGFTEGYIPQGTCYEILLAKQNVLITKISKLKFIVEDCEKACNSAMNDPYVKQLIQQFKLERNEVYSIIIYTYDLGVNGKQSENFYFQINEILRTRVKRDIEAIIDYLYYVLSGLRKLPSIEAVVYRGNSSSEIVKQEYTLGREIFWSGFTSTTTELSKAIEFAGNNGVVFRIKINNGKDISAFSVMGNEHEILLPPNSCLFVSNPIHTENDGIQYVEMVEKVGSFKW